MKMRKSSGSAPIQSNGCDNSSSFVTRFMETTGSSSIQLVPIHSILKRGFDSSQYKHAYASIIDNLDTYHLVVPTDKFSLAIRKLHVSVLPEILPCRSAERDIVQNSIREGIVNPSITRALYISGMPGELDVTALLSTRTPFPFYPSSCLLHACNVSTYPGTGKTATVLASIKSLVEEAKQKRIPEFHFIEINCLRLHTPTDAYTVLWRALSGQFGSAKSAKQRVIDYFQNQSNSASSSSSSSSSRLGEKKKTVVCLMDEMDFLITNDEEVNVYVCPRLWIILLHASHEIVSLLIGPSILQTHDTTPSHPDYIHSIYTV